MIVEKANEILQDTDLEVEMLSHERKELKFNMLLGSGLWSAATDEKSLQEGKALLSKSNALFTKIQSQDEEFQITPPNIDALGEVDFDRNIPIFIAQDILTNPAGFRESWQEFGQPRIHILVTNKEEERKVKKLIEIGLIPEGIEILWTIDLKGTEYKDKKVIVFGFRNSMPGDDVLPEGTQKLQFTDLKKDEGEVLNWERPFMLLLYRLGVRVEYNNLPQERPFTNPYLGTLLSGDPIYVDIPVGVKFEVSDDIHKAYQNFRDAVGGV